MGNRIPAQDIHVPLLARAIHIRPHSTVLYCILLKATSNDSFWNRKIHVTEKNCCTNEWASLPPRHLGRYALSSQSTAWSGTARSVSRVRKSPRKTCKKLFLILFFQRAIGLPKQERVSPLTPLVQTLPVLDFQIASPKSNNSPGDFFNYSEGIFSWKLSALYPRFSRSWMTYYQVSYRQINTANKERKKKKETTWGRVTDDSGSSVSLKRQAKQWIK